MPAHDAFQLLSGAVAGQLSENEPMARHTTYRIGGPAALYVECAGVDDLVLCVEACRKTDTPWAVVGKGSNLLVADSGFDGAVITLSGDFRKHRFDAEGMLVAGAAAQLAVLVQEAFTRGLTGLECVVGVPGTLGGAIAMNAGTRTEWIGKAVKSVTVYDPEAGLRTIAGAEIEWSYRNASIPSGCVIVSATLELMAGMSDTLRGKMETSLARRRETQPLGKASAGSTFRNPEGQSAGALIESCGLAGLSCGGASISDVHANFIVNDGGATASDVIQLMFTARQRVREVHGIELQPEVRFLGFA